MPEREGAFVGAGPVQIPLFERGPRAGAVFGAGFAFCLDVRQHAPGRRLVFAPGVLAALTVDYDRPPIYRGAGALIDRRELGYWKAQSLL